MMDQGVQAGTRSAQGLQDTFCLAEGRQVIHLKRLDHRWKARDELSPAMPTASTMDGVPSSGMSVGSRMAEFDAVAEKPCSLILIICPVI